MSSPLRIGIVLKGGSAWMGGMEYMKNLLIASNTAAMKDGLNIECSIVSSQPVSNEFSRVVGSPLQWVKVGDSVPPARFSRIRRIFSSVQLGRPIDYAVHGANLDFVFPIDSLSKSIKVRRLAWIPDLQHREIPEFSSESELQARERWICSMMNDAPGIVFSSQASRSDFMKHYPKASNALHVLPFRIKMAESVLVAEPRSVVTAYNLPERFILVSNQFWKHKNHMTLFEAIRLGKQRCPDLVVVMTGALNDYRHSSYFDECLQRIHKDGIDSNVRILGLIPKHDQLQLLRACVAVVQPSRFEGWSTIVEEARVLGKHLIVSDLPVHREQDVAAADYFAPLDSGELADSIINIWETHRECPPSADVEREFCLRYDELFLEFGRAFLKLASGAGAFEGISHH